MKTAGLSGSASIGLQTQMTSFVGRAEELIELTRLVRETRLVTLIGPPGVGKTRLAGELAAQEQRGRRCDVALVELASVVDGKLVRERIVTAFKETEQHGASTQQSVGHHRLLVLDNCEHVLDDCSTTLIEILTQDPQIRVLATSREPLRLPGEVVFPLRGLTPLHLDEGASAADLVRLPAIRLFVDRARALLPKFQLTEENGPQIGAVCARLDGLPLAIELAAELVRAFPVADIERRMDDRLDLLVGGWRVAEPRHQSLRAALEWSYNLLTAHEQLLFRVLSVLPGGFGTDVAVAVAGGHGIPVSEVPQLLVALEAKSLISTVTGDFADARFQMLESIRCYGRELRVSSAQEGHTHELLIRWLVGALGDFFETGILSPSVVTRLSAEKDNLRFELEHLDGSADERQLLLAAIMDVLDMLDGTPPDGPWRLSRALGRFGADSAHRPVMLATEAVLAAWRGEHGEAARLADTLLAVDSDGRQERMRMLQLLVGAAQGDQSSGTKLRGCLYTSRNAGDTVMTALCLYTLATQSVLCQDSIKGNQLLEAALGPLSTRDLRGPFRAALQAAGTLALETDDLQRAKDCFTLLLRESDHAHHRALAFEGFALLAVSERRYDHGLRLLSAAETVAGPTRWPAADWWRKRVEEARAKAHDALSPTQANAALAFGRALTAARVTDYALDVKSAKGATEPDGEILSQREWDVAILVSQGLTNRQIGARLYLSVRTVEAHMRNIRMTLGLSTRAHVAAWTAERRGTMLKRHG